MQESSSSSQALIDAAPAKIRGTKTFLAWNGICTSLLTTALIPAFLAAVGFGSWRPTPCAASASSFYVPSCQTSTLGFFVSLIIAIVFLLLIFYLVYQRSTFKAKNIAPNKLLLQNTTLANAKADVGFARRSRAANFIKIGIRFTVFLIMAGVAFGFWTLFLTLGSGSLINSFCQFTQASLSADQASCISGFLGTISSVATWATVIFTIFGALTLASVVSSFTKHSDLTAASKRLAQMEKDSLNEAKEGISISPTHMQMQQQKQQEYYQNVNAPGLYNNESPIRGPPANLPPSNPALARMSYQSSPVGPRLSFVANPAGSLQRSNSDLSASQFQPVQAGQFQPVQQVNFAYNQGENVQDQNTAFYQNEQVMPSNAPIAISTTSSVMSGGNADGSMPYRRPYSPVRGGDVDPNDSASQVPSGTNYSEPQRRMSLESLAMHLNIPHLLNIPSIDIVMNSNYQTLSSEFGITAQDFIVLKRYRNQIESQPF